MQKSEMKSLIGDQSDSEGSASGKGALHKGRKIAYICALPVVV